MDKSSEKTKINFFEEIASDVKNKKELRALDEDFVSRKLGEFFKDIRNYQYKEKVLKKLSESKSYKQFTKSKEHDFLIKNVRAELRKVYGAFILKEYEKKNKILKNLKDQDDVEGHMELLKLHKSTNERLTHYRELYAKILENTSGKLTILDIACGLNPIANIFIRERIKKYYASDISSEDCKFLKEYFSKTNVDNEVFPLDLVEKESFKKLSSIKCDVCFIFKTLDGLERVERNVTEKLFKSINAKILAVTFPTLSLSGVREIKEYRRVWLEKLLEKLEWKYEKIMIENELLYLIKKSE
jgi:16S rRNA (guanine(1405)-N(7))-methyltransferase